MAICDLIAKNHHFTISIPSTNLEFLFYFSLNKLYLYLPISFVMSYLLRNYNDFVYNKRSYFNNTKQK